MRRVIGFALIWVAAGILLCLILPNLFMEILCAALCVLVGYQLFCCK